MSNKIDWRLLGLLIVAIIFSCLRFRFGFYHDGHSLVTTSNILESNSVDYWLDIFSKTNWGAQYRPLSFFVLFNVFSSWFGPVSFPFHFLSMILLILLAYNLNIFFRRQSGDYNLAFWLTLLVLLHPLNWTYSEITFVGKTLIPTLIFSFGLNLYVGDESCNLAKIFLGVVLFSVSILCHEATLFFAPIIIILDFPKKRFEKYLLLIPSVAYLLVRFFVFGVPSQGWMHVSGDGSIERIGQIANFVWYSFDLPFGVVTLIGIIFLFVLALMARSWRGSFVIVLSLFCIIPFGLLPNHFHVDRMVWGALFVSLYLLQLYLRKLSFVPILIAAWIIVNIVGSINAFQSKLKEYHSFEQQIEGWVADFSPLMIDKNDSCQIIRYKVNKLDFWSHLQQLPFVLAVKYPGAKKRIEIFSGNGGVIRMRVQGGTSYYCAENYQHCIDIYERSHFFSHKENCKLLTIYEKGVHR